MGYIRLDISLGRERLEPELCQCTALVSGARAASTLAKRGAKPCCIDREMNVSFLISVCGAAQELNRTSASGIAVGANKASGGPHRHGNCLRLPFNTSFVDRYGD
jgi:hypothetical protein